MVNPNLAVLDDKVLSGHRSSHEIGEQYPPVLIHVREFVNGPENAFGKILPQMVRLQTLDFCHRI